MILHTLLTVPLLLNAVDALQHRDQDGIQSLNQTLGGRVQLAQPFALPCFSSYNGKPHARDDAQCQARQKDYFTASYRDQFPGAYMLEQSALCARNPKDQCLLNPSNVTDASAWTGVDCGQGNIPNYYVDIKSSSDAVHIFNYAAKAGLKLTIKNSGHTFMEDASGKGSLLMWTRNLRSLKHDEHFVPQGCKATGKRPPTPYNAITTGAGVNCGEAFAYADQQKVTILCAYAPTVGISGGYVQNGGHSVISNTLGLAADRVLQYTVVTPDGQLRIANECQNTDLFWALRGGGGGTFGLVIDSTHRVEPAMNFGVADISIPSTDTNVLNQWFDLLVDTALDLADDGWGGHIYGNFIVYVNPKMNTLASASKSLQKLTTFAKAHGGTSNITVAPEWISFYNDYVVTYAKPVGNFMLLGSRLVLRKGFQDKAAADKLKSYIRNYYKNYGMPYFDVTSPVLYKPTPGSTSVSPAWYNSIWEIGYQSTWAWNSTYAQRKADIDAHVQHTKELEALTPGSGAYKNEANPFTPDWQEAWWGGQYGRLEKIKNKYDPKGLLKCWRCVGWTEADEKQACYGGFVNYST